MYQASLYLLYIALASAFAVAAAALALVSKEDVYSALSLGFVGIGVAALMALLGYGILSVFYVLVYVGATVTFVVFSILLIGRGISPERKLSLVAVVTAALIAVSYFLSLYALSRCNARIVELNLGVVGEALFSKHVLSLVFMVFALASVAIEGILIASRKGER